VKVYVLPADGWACGHFRLIWPAELLAAAGHDVTVIPFDPQATRFRLWRDQHGRPVEALYPTDADVLVFQRVVERDIVDLIAFLGGRGVATVVDVDDDLSAIAPGNPAYASLHPQNRRPDRDVSWQYLYDACRVASMVTVTTPALAAQYGGHGRVRVLPNYLPGHYYGLDRADNQVVGWPASYFSHPDDPQTTRGAVSRLVADGVRFKVWGDPQGAGRAFGLPSDPEGTGPVDLRIWPRAMAEIGVGIAPLNDTRFNSRKSWLKPLELSACGVPWVASPRTEYARLHRLGCGVLADKPKVWYREVKRLVEDAGWRAELSAAGREVAAELRLDLHVGQFLDAWEAARIVADAGRLPTPG
jgi:glycosyltransferase involved in cell wall biosynthesis